MMKKSGSDLTVYICICLTLLIFVSCVTAQKPVDAKITAANAIQRPAGWQIEITFDNSFDPVVDTALTDPLNYKIFNFTTSNPVSIQGRPQPSRVINGKGSSVILNVGQITATDLYHLYAVKLTFGGVPLDPKAKLQSPVKVIQQTPNPPSSPVITIAESKNREDSNIYVAYELTKSKNTATTGTGDIKIKIPFNSNFDEKFSVFSALVDVKASSNAKADADSLKFGLDWFYPLHVGDGKNHKPYKTVDWINTGKIEAPKNFDNINAIWDSRFLFPSSFGWGGKHFIPYLDPYIGWEVGKNLKSPLKTAQGNAIARVYYGADLTIQTPFDNLAFLKQIDFEASYTRRHPLTRELSFKKEDNGDYSLVAYGKGPKDYVNSKLIFKINDLLGPYVGFEWGRLPPNYNLVDHTWKIGIIYKSKLKR